MSTLSRLTRRRPRFATFGPGSRVAHPLLEVRNPSGIAIGRGVDIRSHAFLEAISPPGVVVLRIGDGAYVGHFARITALGGVEIGAEVLISDRVYISDTGHAYEDPDLPIRRQRLREGRSVRIATGAWLGAGCAVVGNVRIGRNAVVAANAVVRADVPDHTVVAGDPARMVRRLEDGAWRSVAAAAPA